MCGIAGWFGHLGTGPDDRLQDMVAAIAHRGPDDRGRWVGPGAGLGMARLSIIDLDGGAQPRFAGSWVVVVNGEIYNYRELAAELRAAGVELTGSGDSEVVARAVQHWGDAAFARFDGMFAVAAHDRDSGRCLLARDRFGEKPLYLWRRADGTVAFASEPRALWQLGPMPGIDPDALTRYLALGFVPGPAALWTGVETLDPGQWAEVVGTRIDRHPIADLPDPAAADGPTAVGEDPVDELDRRLRHAVESRLVADVEVGVLLSGGIDSSLVAVQAAAAHPGVHTFSVRIDDPARDESPWSSQVARELGTTHHVVTVGDREALEVVDDLPGIYDEPFADSSAIPTLLLSRFVARHVKVALSGDGGDEFFSGYGRHRTGDVGAAAPWVRPARPVLQRARRTWWVRPQGPVDRAHRRLVEPVDAYLAALGGAGAWGVDALGRDPAALDGWRARVGADRDRGGRWAEAADRGLYLPGDILTKIDRASMSCGLEVRAPFLAPVVADWAAGLPADVIGPPGAKAVPRELLRRRFGPELADRPKRGFSVPLPSWLRGRLGYLVDLACDGHLSSSGLVDRRGVLALRSALHHRFDRAATPLWTIAMFELWYRRWGVSPAAG